MLEKTLKSPLNSKDIRPVNPKGNQPQVFIGRTDAEAEAPVLWPPDEKSWLIGNDPDAGKDKRQEEKRKTEDEMVRWHHQVNGQVWSPCSPRDSQESSPMPQFKSINSSALSFLYSPTLNPYMSTGKTIALTRQTFVDQVMSLLFNMLSRLVITFLPRSKHLLISWLQYHPQWFWGP